MQHSALKRLLLVSGGAIALFGAICLPTLCLYSEVCAPTSTQLRVTYSRSATDAVVPVLLVCIFILFPLSLAATRLQRPALAVLAASIHGASGILLLVAGISTLALLDSSGTTAQTLWNSQVLHDTGHSSTYSSVGDLEAEVRKDITSVGVAALFGAAILVLSAALHALQSWQMIWEWRQALATGSTHISKLGWWRLSPAAALNDRLYLSAPVGAYQHVATRNNCLRCILAPSVAISFPDLCGCSRLSAIELSQPGRASPGCGACASRLCPSLTQAGMPPMMRGVGRAWGAVSGVSPQAASQYPGTTPSVGAAAGWGPPTPGSQWGQQGQQLPPIHVPITPQTQETPGATSNVSPAASHHAYTGEGYTGGTGLFAAPPPQTRASDSKDS